MTTQWQGSTTERLSRYWRRSQRCCLHRPNRRTSKGGPVPTAIILASKDSCREEAEIAAVADQLSREEADRTPDLIRTKINLLPANIREVRTIDIQGLDVQADGGTHVNSTTEVGRIRVVGHESKGRINKRLRIALDD